MGTGPIIGIIVVASFLGFIVLLVRSSGAGPSAARLTKRPESVSLIVRLPHPGEQEHHALLSMTLGADPSDKERVTEAITQSGSLEALARGVVRDAVEAWAPEQTPDALRALSSSVDPAVSSALRTAFAERGVQLREVSAHCIVMTPALRHLAQVWLSHCTRGGPTGLKLSINALEVYIDGVSGRGEIYTGSAQAVGARRERTRSTDLVGQLDRHVNYTVDKPTGMVRLNTFQELMDGAAQR